MKNDDENYKKIIVVKTTDYQDDDKGDNDGYGNNDNDATLRCEKYRSMMIRVKMIAMIIMIMTTTLRGENYDGNDSYDNNDNDDDAEW